ncbi:hypothetical protein MNBD_GAMMA03-1959 [hydrothermal vent metagenome]|uniref:Carboxypeptidase regulatory-like domain-containing protein n=1 Tax=hydrothermal vent metagenome TaxID=652676 RepID=A0A3B0W8B1_9ZZZZ
MKSILIIGLVLISGVFAFKPILKTSLRINIHNELGHIEEDVKIALYTSIEDYRKEENPAFPTQYTDEKGRTTFKNIKPIVYYIHAEKDDKDNVGKGVASDTIIAGKMNRITIIIE